MNRTIIRTAMIGAAAMTGAGTALAQEATMSGEGDSRLCNPVIDSRNDAVSESSATSGVLIHGGTYDCPEPPPVEPAAAAPPLPEQGLIYFDFDKADLNDEAAANLEAIIADIKDRNLGGIQVDGYTDTAGPAEYNMGLSERRAETVARSLIDAGIPATIVTTEAFGETDLAVATPDDTPNQANRRAVIDFSP
jgi:outer membrane protein OmpA-like peptidoglycan-associated protein